MRERSVYISYTTEDAAAVARLKRDLAAAGIPVPVDGNALEDDLRWLPAVKQAIAKCGLFLACFSERTGDMTNTTTELRLALAQHPPGQPWLIPVTFGPCELPPDIHELNAIRLDEQWESGIQSIVALMPPGLSTPPPRSVRTAGPTLEIGTLMTRGFRTKATVRIKEAIVDDEFEQQ